MRSKYVVGMKFIFPLGVDLNLSFTSFWFYFYFCLEFDFLTQPFIGGRCFTNSREEISDTKIVRTQHKHKKQKSNTRSENIRHPI